LGKKESENNFILKDSEFQKLLSWLLLTLSTTVDPIQFCVLEIQQLKCHRLSLYFLVEFLVKVELGWNSRIR
jgi:hypothetical protein